MPSSNETRVRVDGFSKIIASALPASGLASPLGGLPAEAAADVQHPAQRRPLDPIEIEEMPHRRRRCVCHLRPLRVPPPARPRSLVEDRQRLVDVARLDDQRRQHAHRHCRRRRPSAGPASAQPVRPCRCWARRI